MRRGDIWTISGGGDYAGKPRPVVIAQSDQFPATHSITICPLTSNRVDAPFLRPEVQPSPENGLRVLSMLMIDKLTTVPKSKLGRQIGRLGESDLLVLDGELLNFLGLVR